MLLTRIPAVIVVSIVLFLAAAAGADDTPAPVADSTVQRLVQNLASDNERVREMSEAQLSELGPAAVKALRAAIDGNDATLAAAAKAAFDRMMAHTHLVLDALAAPIAGGRVTLQPAKGPKLELTTNLIGGILLPPDQATNSMKARLSHPDYGTAEGWIWPKGQNRDWHAPLLTKESPGYTRACRGVVVDAEGKPIAGATIRCGEVRTPGEGLIGNGENATVFADEAGRFTLYMPDRSANVERGRLVPAGSSYHLVIEPPVGSDLFPLAQVCSNSQPASIRLERPQLKHTFRFEDSEGKALSDSDTAKIRISYCGSDAQRGGVTLPESYALQGGKLLPGFYRASRDRLDFPAVEVTKDSPEVVVFRSPPAEVFVGRVIDAASGKPAAGAIVFGYSGTKSEGTLAMLSDADWKTLHDLPAGPCLDGPGLAVLGRTHSVVAMVRADEEGRFEVRSKPGGGSEVWGLQAIEENRLPIIVPKAKLKPDQTNRFAVQDIPLFPSAKVILRPVSAGGGLRNVYLRWRFEPGAPAALSQILNDYKSPHEFHQYYWTQMDKAQPLFVPAGVKLRLLLGPSEDDWTRKITEVVEVAEGKSVDLGDVTFPRCVEASVRVVDESGKPVEGAPVRRIYNDGDAWTVAHNTDANGVARFRLERHSSGRLGITILLAPAGGESNNAALAFKIDEEPPAADALLIRLTAEQVTQLQGK